MTVRIIQRREPPVPAPIECECRNCGSVFEFDYDDAVFVPDRGAQYLRIGCPVCRRPNHVNASSLDAPEWPDAAWGRAEIAVGGEVVRPATGTLTKPATAPSPEKDD